MERRILAMVPVTPWADLGQAIIQIKIGGRLVLRELHVCCRPRALTSEAKSIECILKGV